MKKEFPPSGEGLPRRRFLQLTAMGALAVVTSDWSHHAFGMPINTKPAAEVAPELILANQKNYLVAPKVPPVLRQFSLAQVRILDGPFKHAQDQDHAYLLVLEPDRFLHNVRQFAGLEPKAPLYGGWESVGLAGHTLGHYLSALSMMYQSTGDPELKRRVDYIVDEMATAQDAYGDGYISAIPGGRAMFAEVKAGKGNGVHPGWAPWYTQHKLLAGLRDAYILTGNEKAKTVFLKLADWAIDTTSNLTDDQWDVMLTQEHGGMCETLADAYAMTGKPVYLEYAHKFSHKQILNPMSEQQDMLDGFHANTQIPKIIGFRRIYELTADPKYGAASRFFWNTVTQNRTYVIGGNSDHEYFFPPAETRNHLSGDTAEACNVYNMLKLTRGLWNQAPNAADMEFYERALFNQILGSQDPVGGDKGGFNYLNALSTGQFKVYSNPITAFWCCVGTGIENHSKYGETIYYHDDNSLWVNLFIASQLNWAEKGLTLTQKTTFPDTDTTSFTLKLAKPSQMALKIRHPSWAKGMKISVNGKPQKVSEGAGYETIDRKWKNGDVVTVQLPMALGMEPLHAAPEKQAFLYGPMVLAANLGPTGLDTDYVDSQTQYSGVALPPAPIFVTDGAALAKIKRADGLNFTAQMIDSGTGEAKTVSLLPYTRAHHMRYGVYFDVLTPEQWKQKAEEIKKHEEAERELSARTVDTFNTGEQQSEVDHAFKGEKSTTGNFSGKKWRDATDGGYFEFQLKTPPAGTAGELDVTYWGGDSGMRTFDIFVDGQKLTTQRLNNDHPNKFWDAVYPISAAMMAGKDHVTIRFAGQPGNMAGGIFGARMLKADFR